MVSTIVVVLILVGLAIAVVWRPPTIIAAAFCVYPFEQWAQVKSSFFASHSTYINLAFGLLALLALVSVAIRGRNPLKPLNVGHLVCLGLYAYAAASCVWSINSEISIFLFRFHLPYVVTFVFLIPLVIHEVKDVRDGLIGTLVFGTTVMLLLLLSTSTDEYGRGIVVEHAEGTVTDRAEEEVTELAPLIVAQTAGGLIFVAMLMNFSGVNKIWDILKWLTVLIALSLIVRSGSRGQLLALGLLPCFYGLSKGYSKAFSVAAGLVLVAAVVGVAFWFIAQNQFVGRFGMTQMTEAYGGTRVVMCQEVLKYWISAMPMYWFFGLGTSACYELVGQYPHVVLIEVLVELGFVGLALIIILLTITFKYWTKLFRAYSRSAVERGTIVSMGAIMAYHMLLTFKQGSMLSHTTTFMSVMLICRFYSVGMQEYRRKVARRHAVMFHSVNLQSATP